MDSIKSRGRHYISAILLVLVGVWFDQFTKTLAVDHLKGQDPFILIKNVFQFEYLENHGAAFGILQNKQIFFFIIVLIISVFIIWFYLHVPMTKKLLPLRICAVFIFSGAIGNFIDRLKLGYVVDFFYFKLIDFPVFNVADIYVTVGTFILVFAIKGMANVPELTDGLGKFIVFGIIVSIGMSLGGLTGYAINPARDLGPRLAHAVLPIKGKGDSNFGYGLVVPIIGPIIGAIAAVLLYGAIPW